MEVFVDCVSAAQGRLGGEGTSYSSWPAPLVE